jgi:hypothetical protein
MQHYAGLEGFILYHAKKCTITIALVTMNAVGTSQRAVCRILAANLRVSFPQRSEDLPPAHRAGGLERFPNR